MGNALGQKKTLQEVMRENKRMVDRSIRELQREQIQLQNQEKKLIMDIKKAAKQNQTGVVRIMAKDLVRSRKNITKFANMMAQLRAISLQMTTVKSTHTMAQAMGKVTRAMGAMNQQLNLPALQKVMAEFARQSEQMDMKQEMMGDALDDALADDNEEEDTDEIVRQVFDEIGINLNDMLDAPGASKLPEAQQEQESNAQDKELEARLNNLRR